MGRNRGQGNQGGDKKKDGGEKVKVRRSSRYTDATRKANKRMHILSEARHAEKKLSKLLKRGWEQKPGGITEGSRREQALSAHIRNLKAHASSIRY